MAPSVRAQALALSVMLWFTVLWTVGSGLELAAMDVPVKIFWRKFQYVWRIPIATAGFSFAMEYANLGHWLNRLTLPLLAVPPVLVLLLICTNDAHHLIWIGYTFSGYVFPREGIAGQIAFVYAALLLVAMSVVFISLFVQSPLHRRAAALCLCGQLVVRGAILLVHSNRNPIAPLDPVVLAAVFTSITYSIALFRFGMFDLVPVARRTVIEQMREGMLVLDGRQRIVDLNPAAERILGMTGQRARGTALKEVLPACSMTEPELTVTVGGAGRHYGLRQSPLKGLRGSVLGSLILLYDVTEERQAQARLLEQQRALATVRERDRVARELHDSLGQVLGFVKMQARAA